MDKGPPTATRNLFAEAFRQAGRRITRQRMLIFAYLEICNTHPSARQIFDDLVRELPTLSLATVYSTLRSLVELDLINELDFEALDNRYDTRVEPHLNLVCTGCGSISDRDQQLPVAPDRILREHGFATTGFRFEYRGLCAACRRGTDNLQGETP